MIWMIRRAINIHVKVRVRVRVSARVRCVFQLKDQFSRSFSHMPVSGFGLEVLSEQALIEEGTQELGFGIMKKGQVLAKRDEKSYDSYTTSSSTVRSVRYGECQKNHAASIGGYAVDGCREFMASGEEGTAAALKCAACGCHRNFHRREVITEVVCECSSLSSNVK